MPWHFSHTETRTGHANPAVSKKGEFYKMAKVLEQDAIFVSYEFEDADGDKTSRRIQLVWDTDLATTLTNAVAISASLQAITDAAVNKFTVMLDYVEDTPAARSGENQEVAHLVLGLNTNPPEALSKTKAFDLPAPVVGIRVAPNGPGNNLIDIANANLTTFLAHFLPAGEAYLSHGQTLDEIKDGYIHHQRSKKG